MTTPMTRRAVLGQAAGGAAFLSATAASLAERLAAAEAAGGPQLQGRVRHSVCKWCYPKISLEDLCRDGKAMGLSSIELLEVKDFETLKKHDLVCAMVSGVPGGITTGLNRLENHDKIVAFFEDTAPKVAAAGFRNIICFSGNRDGMPDEQGLDKCAIGLKRIMPICEKHKVLAVHGTAQQQGQPHGLHVRPHAMGRRTVQERRLGALQAALRHLPHADHGRRRDRARSRRATTTSPTTTPAAFPAGTKSTRRRSSTIRRS